MDLVASNSFVSFIDNMKEHDFKVNGVFRWFVQILDKYVQEGRRKNVHTVRILQLCILGAPYNWKQLEMHA